MRELRKRGVPIALISPSPTAEPPSRTSTCSLGPGGDLALALALGRLAFERGQVHPDAGSFRDGLDGYRALVFSKSLAAWAFEAGVTEPEVLALHALYTRASPAAILVGWGMQRRTNGSAIVRALDALGTVTGNVGVSGGGVSYYFKRRGSFDLSSLLDGDSSPRTVCEPRFGQDILDARDPEIRAVWITAGNPVTMLPASLVSAEALKTREFVVVADGFMTDTARLATVVLPTATLLEDDDVAGSYGHHWIGEVRPIVAPPPEVKTDHEILQALAPRLGLGDRYAAPARVWKQRLLRAFRSTRWPTDPPARSPRAASPSKAAASPPRAGGPA